MSALVSRMHKTIYTPSRVLLAVIGLSILSASLVYLTLQTVQDRKITHAVSYGVTVIAPVESNVCPGPRALRYPVTVIVNETMIPDQIRQAEAWCVAGEGGPCISVAPRGGEHDLPLLAPKRIETVAPRDVPDNLRPGVEYEFHHSVTNAAGQVTGYIVKPIVVREDCP